MIAATKNEFIETRLNWISYLLQRDFDIEHSANEVWRDVYNDAGRDRSIAQAMIEHMANDHEALEDFANSISPHPRSTIVYRDHPDDRPFWIGLIGCGLLSGFLLGAWWSSLVL